MHFESKKPSPNSNSGIEVLLEVHAGTGRKIVVARVKKSNGHILQTLLSTGLESQAGSAVPHLDTPMINAPGKSQRPCIWVVCADRVK